ncbi:alpha/beta fold hydrolase [Mycobacterium montefiorense]|uniref:alpha/beta fold hydrolase n=1 Tax=Mycobacterium montefiorense TaxID=154654 RepID=UPI000D59A462|nr:alpha/beta fold hydrolase [Mycobacterium montefiorense]
MEEFQNEFTPLEFRGSSMNIHKHESLTKVEVVVVFVHGLMGSGYDTWVDFPKFIFESSIKPICDVAVFDYCSGYRKWIGVRPSLRKVSESLAERLGYLAEKNYEHIYIVAHSMGGLISLHAVKHYLDHRDRATKRLKQIAGIMLFGSPLDGSRWSLAALVILFREAGYLWVHAPH